MTEIKRMMTLSKNDWIYLQCAEEVLGSSFAGYVPLPSQNPYPIIVYFWSIFVANYKPHLSHFWANDFLTLKVPKKCDTILVTLLKMLEKATPL